MSGVEKIAISAVIGGTAEALGGGKFANGAVTGAYVMAFNHLMHNKIWHPSRESAEKALKTRVKSTGKEASALVFEDECGDQYFWENPEYPTDTELQSQWTYPDDNKLTFVEEFHYSQELTPDGKQVVGSFQDWVNSQLSHITVTHISLNFGKWRYEPGRFYDGGIFSPFNIESYYKWMNVDIRQIMNQ